MSPTPRLMTKKIIAVALILLLCVLTGFGIVSVCCKKNPVSPYCYSVPQRTNDGWETASLATENIDAVLIGDLFDRINDQSYKNIHSVLLVKNGKLVVEEYFPGRDSNGKEREFDRDMRHEMHSVSKSVNSILVGIAIDQRLIRGVDERASDLLPEYAGVFADHKRDDLRLKHLLTMSSGLSWDEWTHPYSDPRNDLAAMDRSMDIIKYVLERLVIAPPGEKFAYSGGISIVLGEIVHQRSKLLTEEFAKRFLFEPLGISNYRWFEWRSGILNTGGGLVMRPRDMAKIGHLFLNGGRWQGKQIVSERWVAESSRNYVDARQFPKWHEDDGYGYQWWLRSFQVNGRIIPSFHAAGMGGQFIFVFPSLQTVAVFTGWNDNELGKQPFDMLRRYILPAIARASAERR